MCFANNLDESADGLIERGLSGEVGTMGDAHGHCARADFRRNPLSTLFIYRFLWEIFQPLDVFTKIMTTSAHHQQHGPSSDYRPS